MRTRVELLINMAWADKNPDQFVKAVRDFQNEYIRPGWDVTADLSRRGYALLIAQVRTNAG